MNKLDLTKDGMKDLQMHIRNILHGVFFITNHADELKLEDDHVGDLYRAEEAVKMLEDRLKENDG